VNVPRPLIESRVEDKSGRSPLFVLNALLELNTPDELTLDKFVAVFGERSHQLAADNFSNRTCGKITTPPQNVNKNKFHATKPKILTKPNSTPPKNVNNKIKTAKLQPQKINSKSEINFKNILLIFLF